MHYKLEITQEADKDLDNILKYMKVRYYKSTSHRFYKNIIEKYNIISDNPKAFPVPRIDELAEKGWRFVPVGNYLIFYKVLDSEKTIRILRLVDGRSNYMKQLSDGNKVTYQ